MEFSRTPASSFAVPRRVFTAPVPPSSAPQPTAAAPQSAGGSVETLYDSPNVKIVSFTAASRALSVDPRASGAPDIEPGSLPWSTQLERTIAVGPFRIYRAPGSVAFLSCGSALQPILPKSQAWCVDEESSKYVLQIRRPQYWRIEVPVADEEDIRRAQQLRDVFDAILQFEKTSCPFKRSFTVELPEQPQTPVRIRPWTPVRRSSTSLPLTPVTPVEVARLHEGTPRGSICIGDLRTVGEARRALREHARRLEPPAEAPTCEESDQPSTSSHGPQATSLLHAVDLQKQKSTAPPQPIVAAAPSSKVRGVLAANMRTEASRSKPSPESSDSFLGPESWLSAPLPPSPPMSSPGSPRSASPHPQPRDGLPTIVTHHEVLDHAVSPRTSQTFSVATTETLAESECSAATAPSSIHDAECSPTTPYSHPPPPPTKENADAVVEPPLSAPSVPSPSQSPSSSPRSRRPPVRRATTSSSISVSHHHALSPLPPAADLLTARRASTPGNSTSAADAAPAPAAPAHTLTTTTPAQRKSPTPPPITKRTTNSNNVNPTNGNPTTAKAAALAAAVRRLPLAVLHKTCEILLSPPSHLLTLMLRVAARIAAGEWTGLVFGLGEAGETVSVAWDWSDEEDSLDGAGFAGRAVARRPGTAFEGAGRRGWASGVAGDDGAWDGWMRARRRGRGGVRMAGAFPESEDEEEEEEEEEVGPLDMPPTRLRLRGSAALVLQERTAAGEEEEVKGGSASIVGGVRAGQDEDAAAQTTPEMDADAGWGVD